ncbi:hypothetical protein [Nocardioides sp. SYSU DS0651]|uniref:hypothetical protein n=1 Tax=Nocardioides sp. SYSU DS0651 TaxID=3415955 RepID=UPI003F4BE382
MEVSRRLRTRTGAALSLLAVSLLLLAAGRFVRLDDTSGFGDARFVMPLGMLAGVLALAALAVGLTDRPARRSLGAALAVLDVAIVALHFTDPGFRFIWTGYEGELLVFEVVLGVLALVLLTPALWSSAGADAGPARTPRRLTAWARIAIYTTTIVVGMYVAFGAGSAHFEAENCSAPDFDGECDLAALEGVVWAGAVLVLGTATALVVELVRFWRVRAERRPRPVG